VIRSAAIVTFIFSLVIGFSAYYTGALTHVYFEPSTLPKLADGSINFDSIIPTLLTGVLPEFLMAVILLLVLSASMSTLASLVLVSSSSIAIDMYKPLVLARIAKTGAGRDRSLLLIRILSGVFVVISYLIARYPFGFIVTLMSLSWGCIAGAFMAPYLYSLFWKRCTRAGVWAGMISGLSTMIILFFWKGPSQSPLWASCAMILPFAVVPLVSSFSKAPSKGILDKAFAAGE
jgi:SSS family solute:Na+ symporter